MLQLPDFPWDLLEPAKARAAAHPGGIVDLSVGSPVDPVPELIRTALAEATNAPAYPLTSGTVQLRQALADWYAERRGVELGPENVIPTIGSKELVALLPTLLGLGAGDVVVLPSLAYPTYEVGALIAGATPLASDDPAEWPAETKLVWLNSPRNPDGQLLSVETLRAAVERARELGAVIANDECYAELDWSTQEDVTAPCILDPRVVGESRRLVLSVSSLSKQSNLAGYRAAFLAGDDELVAQLLEVRKHAGLIPPGPVQAAMVAALGDHAHVVAQRELYRARRAALVAALEGAGFRIDESTAGLYLWATRGEDCWTTIDALAGVGILAAPGAFYGKAGGQHVRLALTATDERIAAAAERLAAIPSV